MSSPFCTWLAFVLGLLFGLLLGWLLDLLFRRGRQRDCERRLAAAQEELRARDAELRIAREQGDRLQADLAALKAPLPTTAGELALPGAAAAAPVLDAKLSPGGIESPEVKAELPSVGVQVPEVQAELPSVDIEVPGVKAELPAVAVEVPDVVPEPLAATAEMPSFRAEGLTVELPEPAAAEMASHVKWPEVSAGMVEVVTEPPDLAAVPDAGAPSLGAELPETAAGLPAGALAALAAAPGPEVPVDLRLAPAAAEAAPVGARVVGKCPQDLSRVKGIGTAYEQKLYSAGIGTFWDLTQASDEDLTRIFELKEFQRVDLGAMKADALRLAERTGTLGRTWDLSQPDDFEGFVGIGETYEGRLYDAGICTYRALADATVEQLAEICKAPEWRRPDYASWIAQARQRLAG